ncbi:protein phosphatase 1 regulatory subunit 21 [Culicoides brevitarsis]|uniref:protein phosphatase 1 regulatory subunit 21 n=1 Tax=Culicoides brevitarsis TaxID=469753 RepID=UPI00307CAD67
MSAAPSEGTDLSTKYQKLASEYSKLRAQAGVLKRAVVEEQNKNAVVREQVRLKDLSVRRLEQEIDSLNFRNKQLELRCASLQEDLQTQAKKKSGGKSGTSNKNSVVSLPADDDPIIQSELQRRIIENAQLTSSLTDKNIEIQMYIDRLHELEDQLNRKGTEHQEIEKRLKREIESLHAKNTELENKVIEGASTLSCDDRLSVSGSEGASSNHQATLTGSTPEEKIAALEKELNYWRTQYEIMKISESLGSEHLLATKVNGPNSEEDAFTKKTLSECNENVSNEQLIQNSFSKRIEAVLFEKCEAEAKIASHVVECENLRQHVELLNDELSSKDEAMKLVQQQLSMCEDDLASTRLTYEEQISVMTEQLISLSEQLAATT